MDLSANQETQLTDELMLSSLTEEVNRVILSSPTLDKAMQVFMLGVQEMAGIQEMALFEIEPNNPYLKCIYAIGSAKKNARKEKVTRHANFLEKIWHSQSHYIVEKSSENDPFIFMDAEQYILIPLLIRDLITESAQLKPIGLLWLNISSPCPRVTGQVISHISSLAQQISMVLENFHIHEQLKNANTQLQSNNVELNKVNTALNRAHQKINLELEQARAVQDSLLPKHLPLFVKNRIATHYVPAGKVGGDYYDCFEIEPGRLAVVIADVSGHGMAAAMIMSMFKILLKNFSTSGESPAKILARINSAFLQEISGANFVTTFFAIYESHSRELQYCNAGHIQQWLQMESGDLKELASQSLFIGMFPDPMLKDCSIVLPEGVRLLLLTDGVTEAHNGEDQMFGMEAIKTLLKQSRAAKPEQALNDIIQALKIFQSPTGSSLEETPRIGGDKLSDLSDDITLVILDL